MSLLNIEAKRDGVESGFTQLLAELVAIDQWEKWCLVKNIRSAQEARLSQYWNLFPMAMKVVLPVR